MTSQPIDLDAALAAFSEHWSPRIIARFNDYDVRLAKVLGDYVWHRHVDTDELFLVLSGSFAIDLRDAAGQRTVQLAAGSVFVVPKGTEHRPRAQEETALLLLDPVGTLTTGDFAGEVPTHITSTSGTPLNR